ncbi:mitochondrial RNA binding protein [Trypanosoma equiperdum]|uniref:Mitochondrial RNA binding protein n=5 Tax=Trypanozoon TaxID=39700 RepID=D6XL11_TRYB2|nr:mitochondrial RNA binding protein, putative [Trypanosoma brucei gambiense DAL972]XP_847107.1 mitochondrial RNA binding protein [Trypanosoma brucei brucei TREU927]AAO39843.1 mitochondrial RNA-binding protein RBP38 [Trypanosoma brucei]RHW70966.1 mitochondrial RNA binding protein [Trypanosoma brucei equiperdum]SCU66196.1 mitochondrial RNA binding protein [Trypanosoma equiperdum]AAX69754.1 mitochondrial RNA binding protein [Trypanosoma brucei]AAZ13041.1 mitochondrial RNA binding protein [Trypa|eukprot:XP_011775558.1 mitochondrial RNA binding protein, putative [Trypanosoma brucei gambiense DAL972]
MFRRLTQYTGVVGAVRTIVVFSQQHHILESNQKARSSPSNVWIEDWEAESYGLTPEPGAVSTQLLLDKPLELYNFDQLLSPPEVMEAPKHSSYSSRKVYGEKLQFELNDRAQKHGFHSKWWLTRTQAVKNALTFKNNARSSIILSKSSLRLYHSSQLVGGEALMTHPVSGGSRKLYSRKGDAYQVLCEHIRQNAFNSGLYFTRRQLEFFKLAVQPSQAPVMMDVSSGERFLIFNVEQLEDPEVALRTLDRSPVSIPTFLLSGEPMQHEGVKRLPRFKSNYWLSGRDAELYQWPIKESEKKRGVTLKNEGSASLQVELFNVEQLANPEEAFAKAGLFVQ